ncbi:phosphohistidine phosphatase SixA, partial [bacterium]|nr:phosphohistidine phosphatase SixA [bacterium]
MQLFLLRHGIAEPADEVHDSERALTVEGREKIQKIAGAMIRMRVQVEHIVTSPLLRAVQTANQVAEVCNVDKVQFCDELLPEARPELVLSFLEREFPQAEA